MSKRAKKKPKPLAGAAYRKAAGLVGTVVYWTPAERELAKEAAGHLGMSLQAFVRAALLDRATACAPKNSPEKN